MCDPMTMAVMTIGSAAASAAGSIQAGNANAAAQKLNSEEMQKQIKQVKLQAMDEENRRREDSEFLRNRNVAAAAATGALSTSASFQNIDKYNADTVNRDVNLIRTNTAQKRGQLSQQQYQYDLAGHSAKQAGKIGAIGSLFQAGSSIAQGGPMLGGSGSDRISSAPKSSLRPRARPKIGVIGGY